MNYMSKNIKMLISYMLIGIGLISFSFSVYLYLNPLKDKDPESIKKEAFLDCKAASKKYGFAVAQSGDSIDFITYGLEDWKNNLSSMSFIILQCPGFSISEFCMGTECKDTRNKPLEGTYMRLKYFDEDK